MSDSPKSTGQRLTLDEIFASGGILADRLPSYEYRPSQRKMAEAVLEAIESPHPLFVEAGTGTGKTLAYLIPALFSRRRVIVSTATRNLQDQLFFKDIPFIREHLFPNLAVTYMKGRGNYLCLWKLHEPSPQVDVFQGAELEKKALTQWAQDTQTGDRSELEWIADDDLHWRHLDARSETCTGQKCSYFDQCFVTRMRQKALESDLIVVNHALLFANLALESDEIGRVLPDFAVLILDEAHEVEDIATTHFGSHVSNYQIEELCRDGRRIFSGFSEIVSQIDTLQHHLATFFDSLPGGEGRHSFNLYKREGSIIDLRVELQEGFRQLEASLLGLYHSVQRQTHLPSDADPLIRRLEQTSATLGLIFNVKDSESVYWFEKRGRGVFFHINPIDVAPVLQEKLYARADSVVLTSATLTTEGSFEYCKERLGIKGARELSLAGEFSYREQSILYIPKAFPEPRSSQYFSQALTEMESILDVSQGHAFLLFTSIAQMERFYEALTERSPFPLFRQGEMPKNQLLKVFKETPRAVLCASSSFWQGVDVQGDALRVVIIDKLPFLVPSEPLVAARIKRLEEQGRNSFVDYCLPEAIISLKQGLGRLIRSRKDRGILAIFDSRLRTRSYGQVFLRSLPECPVTDSLDDLRIFFESSDLGS